MIYHFKRSFDSLSCPLLFLKFAYYLVTEGKDEHRKGLLNMKMAEGAKLQMCYLLHHLCDTQLRHRVESIISFSHDFVGEIQAVSSIDFVKFIK